MKICLLIEAWWPIYGGGQTYVHELCKELSKLKVCTLDVYTRRLFHEGKRYENCEKLFPRVKLYRVGSIGSYNSTLSRFQWVFAVVKHIYSKDYDIINAQANIPGLPGKIIQILKKIPLIYTVHGSGLGNWDELGSGINAKISYFIEKILQTHFKYDLIITVDERFKDIKNRSRIVFIPNAVDISKFDQINQNVESEFFKILFVGRLHPEKGLKYLIDSVSQIKNHLKGKAQIHIIGTGKLEKELRHKVKSSNLDKIVIFRGSIFGLDLIKEYKSSHIFILPSIYEGFPLTLLEAWAAKIPVIITNVGQVPFIVENKKDGYLIPPKNVKALSEAILAAMQNADLREMGLFGYMKAKNRYKWRKTAKKTLNVFNYFWNKYTVESSRLKI